MLPPDYVLVGDRNSRITEGLDRTKLQPKLRPKRHQQRQPQAATSLKPSLKPREKHNICRDAANGEK